SVWWLLACLCYPLTVCRGWRLDERQLGLVESLFYLRHRTLPLSVYQLVLQPSITALEGRLVIEGVFLVGGSRICAFASHAAMGAPPALPCVTGAVRSRIGATLARSRSTCANRNCRAMATDVRTARSDA